MRSWPGTSSSSPSACVTSSAAFIAVMAVFGVAERLVGAGGAAGGAADRPGVRGADRPRGRWAQRSSRSSTVSIRFVLMPMYMFSGRSSRFVSSRTACAWWHRSAAARAGRRAVPFVEPRDGVRAERHRRTGHTCWRSSRRGRRGASHLPQAVARVSTSDARAHTGSPMPPQSQPHLDAAPHGQPGRAQRVDLPAHTLTPVLSSILEPSSTCCRSALASARWSARSRASMCATRTTWRRRSWRPRP